MLHGQNPFYLTLSNSFRYFQSISTGLNRPVGPIWAVRPSQGEFFGLPPQCGLINSLLLKVQLKCSYRLQFMIDIDQISGEIIS